MTWVIYAAAAAVIWGLDYTLGEKIFNAKISPISLLTFQLLCGGVVFLITGLSTKNLVSDIHVFLNDKVLLWVFIAAIVTFNLGNYLIFLSIESKNATLSGIIELSYPIFTILFTWLFFRVSHINISTLIGAVFIFIGAFIITRFGYS